MGDWCDLASRIKFSRITEFDSVSLAMLCPVSFAQNWSVSVAGHIASLRDVLSHHCDEYLASADEVRSETVAARIAKTEALLAKAKRVLPGAVSCTVSPASIQSTLAWSSGFDYWLRKYRTTARTVRTYGLTWVPVEAHLNPAQPTVYRSNSKREHGDPRHRVVTPELLKAAFKEYEMFLYASSAPVRSDAGKVSLRWRTTRLTDDGVGDGNSDSIASPLSSPLSSPRALNLKIASASSTTSSLNLLRGADPKAVLSLSDSFEIPQEEYSANHKTRAPPFWLKTRTMVYEGEVNSLLNYKAAPYPVPANPEDGLVKEESVYFPQPKHTEDHLARPCYLADLMWHCAQRIFALHSSKIAYSSVNLPSSPHASPVRIRVRQPPICWLLPQPRS